MLFLLLLKKKLTGPKKTERLTCQNKSANKQTNKKQQQKQQQKQPNTDRKTGRQTDRQTDRHCIDTELYSREYQGKGRRVPLTSNSGSVLFGQNGL